MKTVTTNPFALDLNIQSFNGVLGSHNKHCRVEVVGLQGRKFHLAKKQVNGKQEKDIDPIKVWVIGSNTVQSNVADHAPGTSWILSFLMFQPYHGPKW